jgi:nicotinamidase-related amidase
MPPDPDFKPALLVIDLQEDFCPPVSAAADCKLEFYHRSGAGRLIPPLQINI